MKLYTQSFLHFLNSWPLHLGMEITAIILIALRTLWTVFQDVLGLCGRVFVVVEGLQGWLL